MDRASMVAKLDQHCKGRLNCNNCVVHEQWPDCPTSAWGDASLADLERCFQAIDKQAETVPATTRKTVLEAAAAAVCGHRATDYGTPEDNFGVIAHLWSVYKGTQFTATDVAMMMALLKIARIKSGTATADSFVDLAGYAACAAECAEKEKHGKA